MDTLAFADFFALHTRGQGCTPITFAFRSVNITDVIVSVPLLSSVTIASSSLEKKLKKNTNRTIVSRSTQQQHEEND